MEKNLSSFHFGFSHVLELGRILKGEKNEFKYFKYICINNLIYNLI